MEPTYTKAKIIIELESGMKAEFVAMLYVRDRPPCPFDPGLPSVFRHDGRWNDNQLPDPPRWDIEGTTIGALVMTLK